jgi:hypothetical protein
MLESAMTMTIGLLTVIMVGLSLAWIHGRRYGIEIGHGAAREGVAMEAVQETAERLVAYTRALEKGCPRCGHRLIAGEIARVPAGGRTLKEFLSEERSRMKRKKGGRS